MEGIKQQASSPSPPPPASSLWWVSLTPSPLNILWKKNSRTFEPQETPLLEEQDST